jgi:hypothetical protein
LLGHINGTLEGWGSSPLLQFHFAFYRLGVSHELILDSNNQMRKGVR